MTKWRTLDQCLNSGYFMLLAENNELI